MKTTLLLIIIFAAFTSCVAIAATPEEEAGFVAAARKAFESHDVAALVALTCWDRVPDKLKASGTHYYARDVAMTVTDVKLTDPDPKFPDLDWTEGGVTYHSNLPVTKQLKIALAPGAKIEAKTGSMKVSDVTYPVGEKEGKLFLLEPAPVK